jgi:predicted house-cleaning noncanonical NTP pyrophosphatase (MazG superfamily)
LTFGGQECVRQHKLVFDMMTEVVPKKRRQYMPKVKMRKLRTDEVREKYCEKLLEEVKSGEHQDDVNRKWKK